MDILDVFSRDLDWGDYNALRLSFTVGELCGATVIAETLASVLFWCLLIWKRNLNSPLWIFAVYMAALLSINTLLRGIDTLLSVVIREYIGSAFIFWPEFVLYASIAIFHPLASCLMLRFAIWKTRKSTAHAFYATSLVLSLLCSIGAVATISEQQDGEPPKLLISLLFILAHLVSLGSSIGIMLLVALGATFLWVHRRKPRNFHGFLWASYSACITNLVWVYSRVGCFGRLAEHFQHETVYYSYARMGFFFDPSEPTIEPSPVAKEARAKGRTILLFHQLFPIIFFVAVAVAIFQNKRRCDGDRERSSISSQEELLVDSARNSASSVSYTVQDDCLASNNKNNTVAPLNSTSIQPISNVNLLPNFHSNSPCVLVVPIDALPHLYGRTQFHGSLFPNARSRVFRPATSPSRPMVPIVENIYR